MAIDAAASVAPVDSDTDSEGNQRAENSRALLRAYLAADSTLKSALESSVGFIRKYRDKQDEREAE